MKCLSNALLRSLHSIQVDWKLTGYDLVEQIPNQNGPIHVGEAITLYAILSPNENANNDNNNYNPLAGSVTISGDLDDNADGNVEGEEGKEEGETTNISRIVIECLIQANNGEDIGKNRYRTTERLAIKRKITGNYPSIFGLCIGYSSGIQ